MIIERYSCTTIWVSLRYRYVSRFSSELQSASSGMVYNGGSPRKYVGVSPRVLKQLFVCVLRVRVHPSDFIQKV